MTKLRLVCFIRQAELKGMHSQAELGNEEYMGQLRQKLETDPTHPRYLLTESGIGYRLAD